MAKVADGIRYAERVVAGEIVAGEFVRLACQRFLDDLKYGEERGIYFSEPRAQHILNFYKFVPHVKGALAGQPIELMDWHVFILINIFGFVIPLVNEETGEVVMRSDGSGRPVMVRRFRTAYNEVARKNAKSTLSSGIGLYMTGADGEGGAEVYSAATTRDQARIVFEDAKNMVRKARSTLGRLFDFNKLAIYQEQSASKFEPLSSDANNLDGLNIHCAIIDELHAHKTRDVWDVLETATGARLQSLLFGITTAGFNKEGICYEQRDYAIKVLRGYNSDVEGAVKDDSYFAIIYTLDEGDDPFDETVWQKANPGLGICKRWDDLRRLAKKAKEQVSARVNFFTKHMNVWVTAESAWMDMIKWEKCEYIAPQHELKTYPMWVGVDLAHKIDICAAAKLWRTDNGHVHADFKFWLPEGRLERCSRQMKHQKVLPPQSLQKARQPPVPAQRKRRKRMPQCHKNLQPLLHPPRPRKRQKLPPQPGMRQAQKQRLHHLPVPRQQVPGRPQPVPPPPENRQKVPHRLLQQPQRRLAKPLNRPAQQRGLLPQRRHPKRTRKRRKPVQNPQKRQPHRPPVRQRHRHHLRLLQKMRRPDRRQQRRAAPRRHPRKQQRRQAVRRQHLRAKLLLNPLRPVRKLLLIVLERLPVQLRWKTQALQLKVL